MNEPDFSAYADLWRQEPAEEEVRTFRRLARRASRGSRLLRQAETGAGVAIAAAAVVAFLVVPGLVTGLVAGLLVLVTLWAAWQRHRLDAVAAELSRNDRHAMLESSERSARAALRKSTVGVLTAFPGWLAAIALTGLVANRGDYDAWVADLAARLTAVSTLVSVLIVVAVTLGAWRQNRRLRRELARIALLRAAYREEDLLDRAAPTPRKSERIR